MKFSAIVRGTQAKHDLDVPGFLDPDGKPVHCLARVLTAMEEADVLERALVFAKGKGVATPAPGDELYDLGVMANTLAVACEAVEGGPFFDGGAEQAMTNLHPEAIAYMFERHEQWQSEASPYARQLSMPELLNKVSEVTAPDGDRVFMRLSPAMRWAFTHSMASLLLTLPGAKSLFGLDSVTN